MNTVRRVAKNTLSLASAEVITKLLAFVMILFIARHLQDVGFGKYSFALAFASFFAIVSDLGLSTLTIREVARDKSLAGKYLGNILLVKFVLSFVSFLLVVIAINLMHYPPDTTLAVYIAGASVVVTSFNQFFRSIFRAFEKMEYEAVVRVVEKVVVFILVMCLIYFGYGLIEILFAFLISSVLSLIFSGLIVFKKFAKPKFEVDFSFLKNAIKEALPFGLTAIFVVIYFRIDTVMLSVMEGDAVVGWYNAAYNIIAGLTAVVAGSIVGVSYPLMSRYFKTADGNLKKIYVQLLQVLFASGLFISIFVTIFSAEIIQILYDYEYSNSAMALKVLIWAFFIICISTISSTLLYSINKQKIVMIGTGLGAILNIILNLILIPHYSLVGAAYATVATELFGFIIYFYYSIKLLKINWKNPHIFVDATKANITMLKKLFQSHKLRTP